MAEKADGSVLIKIDLDAGDTEKELARLKKKALRLEEALTVGKHKKGVLTEELESYKKALEELESQAEFVDTGGPFKKKVISEETIQAITDMKAKIQETEAAIQKQNAELREAEMTLDGVKLRFGEVAQAAQAPEPFIMRFMSRVAEIEEVLDEKMGKVAASIKNAFSKALSAAGNLAKKTFSGMVSLVKKVGASILSLGKSTKSSNSFFSSGIGQILKYGLSIRSLYALAKKLKSALVDGFKNLAQYSDETNKSISMVKSALTQLKNSFATAFAPLLNIVAPILTKFINMMSTAADYAARLAAALTGKTSYTRAKKVQEDYAASLEGTADAADDAAGSLAGFDEINQITTEDTASGVSVSDMFEDVEVEPLTFDSWGDAFSSMLDKIIHTGIPKLKTAFSSFAKWLNTLSANLYQTMTFPGVYDKIVMLGTELANAVNGLVREIDWATLGGAIGAGLNAALGLMTAFVYNFDWIGLGGKIAVMLNGAIAAIDWYSVGQLLWAKFKIALETLAGFLLSLDMPQLGQAASNLVMGLLDSITSTFASIDWEGLGQQVKDFLVNIDWAGIAESVFTAIGAAFGAAVEFLWGFIKDAWSSVVAWWRDTAYEDGKFTLEGLLSGIWDVCKNIGTWIKDHIFTPFVEGFKKVFGIHSPSTVMAEIGTYIMQGLLNGVSSLVDAVVSLFTSLKTKVLDIFDGLWGGMKKVINSILGGIEWLANKVISGINAVISALNRLHFDLPSWLGGGSFGISIKQLSPISIPRLATGAVIPPNREFMAVLGDQKSGNNIEAPEALIRKIVREEAGGMNTELLEAILEAIKAGHVMKVDKKVLAETAASGINDMTRAAGKSVILV